MLCLEEKGLQHYDYSNVLFLMVNDGNTGIYYIFLFLPFESEILVIKN